MLFDAGRGLARRLLPARVRKPVADFIYRSVDRGASLRARLGRIGTRLRGQSATGEYSTALTPGGLVRKVRALPGWTLAQPARAQRLGVRLVQAWILRNLPLLWARQAPTGSALLRLKLLRRLLDTLDSRFEHRFATLSRHALPARVAREVRPRLCMMIGTLGPGGAERQATNTVVGLQAHYDLDVQVVATYQDVEWQRFFAPTIRSHGVPVDALPIGQDPVALLAGCGHPDAARLAAAIAATLPASLHDVALYTRELLLRSPDVVHLWLDEVNVRAGLAALLAGVPGIVLSTRSINPSNFPLFQPYMRAGYRVLSAAAHVRMLNNSETGARDYERWVDWGHGQVTVLRNGFDFERMLPADAGAGRRRARQRFDFAEHDVVVGGVMRFSEEKRPLLWLDAAERVLAERPSTRFLLVGDGALRKEVEERAARGRLAGRVVLPGHDKEPYDTISAMDVLFLSSIHEGLPNVLIEAQALGVPVVTMRAGGAPETLSDGETGWVVQGDDAAAAAQVLGAALADPDALRAAGERGKVFARQHFGYRRMVDETARIYGHAPQRPGFGAAARAEKGGELGGE